MGFTHKPSQPRKTQLGTTLPPMPESAPQELRDWFDQLKGAIDEDRETIERAFAELRDLAATLATSAALAELTDRVEALEGSTGTTTTVVQSGETHENTNDPTANEKAALAGTEGDPSDTNRYVTDEDPRLDDVLSVAHFAEAHGHSALREGIEEATILAHSHSFYGRGALEEQINDALAAALGG